MKHSFLLTIKNYFWRDIVSNFQSYIIEYFNNTLEEYEVV